MKRAIVISLIALFFYTEKSYSQDIQVQSGHSEKINSLKFSPDNKFIVTSSMDHTVKLWDVFTGKEIKTFKGSFIPLNNLYFIPENNMIASYSEDNILKVWTITDGNNFKNIPIKTDNNSKSEHQAILNTNKIFDINKSWTNFAYINSKKIILQDFKTNKILRSIPLKINNIEILKFTNNGKYIMVGDKNGFINIWNCSNGKLFKTIKAYNLPVKNFYVDANNTKIVSSGEDNQIKNWDFKTGKLLNNNDKAEKFLFSSDNFITSKSPAYQIIDSENINHHYSFAISNNNKFIAIYSDNSWKLFDNNSGKNIYSRNFNLEKIDSTSVRGKYISFSSKNSGIANIKQWDLSTGLLSNFSEQNSSITDLEYNPDGELLASGNESGEVKIWMISSKMLFQNLATHIQAISTIGFDNESLYIATGSYDNTIKIWRAGTGTELITLKGHEGAISSLSFNPNSELLLSSSYDHSINIWDVIDGKSIKKLFFSASVNSAKFSPDGSYFVVVTGDNTHKNIHDVISWDLKSGKQINVFKEHLAKVNSVSFNADGTMFATAGSDQKIKIWQPHKPTSLITMQGHTNEIFYTSFSYVSRNFLVSASRDNTIKLWNLSTGKEIVTLMSFKNDDYLIITPDGYYMGSEGIEKYLALTDKNTLSDDNSLKKLNRPDIVLQRIGYASNDLILRYKDLYDKQ